MRMTKLGAAMASLAITTVGATALATAPAQAGVTAGTPTTVHLSFTDPATGHQYSGWRVLYGDHVAIITTVISDGTNAPTAGTATLQRRLPGAGWKTLQTDSDLTDGVTFNSPKAAGNAFLRVEYSGGTDGTTTWTASTSNQTQILTYWNFHMKLKFVGRTGVMYGTLSPHVKNHRILIQVQHNGWKKYKVIHTDGKSHWSARVTPGHNRYITYRAVVAGTKSLQKSDATAKFKLTFNRTDPSPSARVLTQR
jgi:hypothetical protein